MTLEKKENGTTPNPYNDPFIKAIQHNDLKKIEEFLLEG